MPRPIEFDREEVLLKAMLLFNEEGYAACSIQNLLDTMGLNRGSFYSAFEGKRIPYLETLDLYEQLFVVELEKFLLAGESPLERIHTFFEIAFMGLPEGRTMASRLLLCQYHRRDDRHQPGIGGKGWI